MAKDEGGSGTGVLFPELWQAHVFPHCSHFLLNMLAQCSRDMDTLVHRWSHYPARFSASGYVLTFYENLTPSVFQWLEEKGTLKKYLTAATHHVDAAWQGMVALFRWYADVDWATKLLPYLRKEKVYAFIKFCVANQPFTVSEELSDGRLLIHTGRVEFAESSVFEKLLGDDATCDLYNEAHSILRTCIAHGSVAFTAALLDKYVLLRKQVSFTIFGDVMIGSSRVTMGALLLRVMNNPEAREMACFKWLKREFQDYPTVLIDDFLRRLGKRWRALVNLATIEQDRLFTQRNQSSQLLWKAVIRYGQGAMMGRFIRWLVAEKWWDEPAFLKLYTEELQRIHSKEVTLCAPCERCYVFALVQKQVWQDESRDSEWEDVSHRGDGKTGVLY